MILSREEKISWAIEARAHGHSLQLIATVLEVTASTILRWTNEAIAERNRAYGRERYRNARRSKNATTPS
jgi:transposase